ncbi:MAG: hypothetical protein ACTTKD_09835 [Peptoanaerobacter stomatis]|uniref:hypothetical protein n=1 Tax=Peptoanaerobacter stomatis TaxID=796937 RepID=UPI003F9EEBD8
MRKLFLKIIIVFISFLIYFAMFTAFDSNDFSRVRVSCLHNIDDIKVVSYNGDNIFSNSPYPLLKYINDIDKNNEYSIILGDSKFTFLDVMRLSKIFGEKYLNISYGGGGIGRKYT